MRCNADDAAFASEGDNFGTYGLTKREYFAAVALQGMLANPKLICEGTAGPYPSENLERWAKNSAECLITELNK